MKDKAAVLLLILTVGCSAGEGANFPFFGGSELTLSCPVPKSGPPLCAALPPADSQAIEPSGRTGKPGKLVRVSYYGGAASGQRLSKKTASGEHFNPSALTAAHRTLPFGTNIKLRNLKNGKEVTVRVNDRGPFIKSRELDISLAAAHQLGIERAGVQQLEMVVMD